MRIIIEFLLILCLLTIWSFIMKKLLRGNNKKQYEQKLCIGKMDGHSNCCNCGHSIHESIQDRERD
jgi:hypothetical protein